MTLPDGMSPRGLGWSPISPLLVFGLVWGMVAGALTACSKTSASAPALTPKEALAPHSQVAGAAVSVESQALASPLAGAGHSEPTSVSPCEPTCTGQVTPEPAVGRAAERTTAPQLEGDENGGKRGPLNVLGGALSVCSMQPRTGWFRDGACRTGPMDSGIHVVCAELNDDFLAFTKERGNDLTTPKPKYGFPGLKAGDRWCLCAARWYEAQRAGKAPSVVLEASHTKATTVVPIDILKAHKVARAQTP